VTIPNPRLQSYTGGLRDEAMAFTYFVLSKDKIGCKTLCWLITVVIQGAVYIAFYFTVKNYFIK
jgi:hypothetical protein